MSGSQAATTLSGAPTATGEGQIHLVMQEWRQGWRPGLAAVVGNALGTAFWMSISSLFIEPLQTEFGWSRGDIALAHSAGLISAFTAPLIGRLVDRVGPKPVLVVGLALVSLSYLMLSQLNGSLTFYYATYFMLTMAGMTTTGMTYTRIIVGAFTRTRGTALAFLRIGGALSQAILPLLLLYPVIARYGSTGGFLVMAALSLFVALPAVLLLVPPKDAQAEGGADIATQEEPARWQVLIRDPKVVIICLAATLNILPLVAIMTQLQPLGVSVGLSPTVAVGALSALGLAHGLGALIAGVFVDRLWAPIVGFAMCALSVAGCLALVLLGNDVPAPLFYFSAVAIGIGIGAELDVVAYMVARYFGVRNYGMVSGLMAFCIAVGMAASSFLIGHAYDAFGNYDVALLVGAACVAFSGFGYLTMGKYPDQTSI